MTSPRRLALADEAKRRLALRSSLSWRFYRTIFTRSMRAQFHAVRLSRAGEAPVTDAPLVLYTNHPSWWDACVYVVVAARLFPERILRAPIDEPMIEKYAFMPRIGLFGIKQGESGGALFLAICREILSAPRGFLMMTAQGRFADVRERPLALAPGLAHLADLRGDCLFVPLALDYTYWNEKRGEVLLRFGAALTAGELAAQPKQRRRAQLEAALSETMDALASEAMTRDPKAFRTVLAGRRGVHPMFDAVRRLTSMLRRQPFDPGHGGAS
jgi:hypothetical protein